MMTINEMKNRKKQLGLSYEMIAERSGLSIATIKKIFGGETETPRYETLIALEEALSPDKWKLGESVAFDYGRKPSGYKYTIEDYYSWPDDCRCELIDGVVYDLASPSLAHQIIAEELGDKIRSYIRSNGGLCRASALPMDTQLSEDDNTTIVQPDVYVVCDPSKFSMRGIVGAPDLVIEILSPSTKDKDVTTKLYKYKSTAVREYWVVDPEEKRVIVYYFDDDNRIGLYSFRDDIPVGIFGGDLVIHFAQIDDYLENFISICGESAE